MNDSMNSYEIVQYVHLQTETIFSVGLLTGRGGWVPTKKNGNYIGRCHAGLLLLFIILAHVEISSYYLRRLFFLELP